MKSQQAAGVSQEGSPGSATPGSPTPLRVLSRLAVLPSYPPPKAQPLGDGIRLKNLISGDMIAIDGRWWDVLRCTSMNRWVTVQTPGPKITAHEASLVHLARKELPNVEALAPGQ
ncbi:hypothetical protein GCM10009839_84950 [Catenulispora yoronensis]|uniref:Uncharacterized protein n=1 Tax=Catenulispora yoronensis TaxID=450799 RepID=A0ABN2VFX1_9ACTN